MRMASIVTAAALVVALAALDQVRVANGWEGPMTCSWMPSGAGST